MTTAQLSMIAPPPSVAAVLGALTGEKRIGQVDFTTRLAPEPEEVDEVEGAAAPLRPEEIFARQAEAEAEADEDDGDDDDHIEDEPEDTDELPDASDEHEDEVTAEVRTLVSVPAPAPDEPESVDASAAEVPVAQTPVAPAAEAPAAETPAAPEAQETAVQEFVVPTDLEARIHEPARLQPFTEPPLRAEVDERPPSVEEIARLVVERMHDAELAMMRHLDAIEVEAARRAELLTAQAELDAELIRLSARRDAHAIVTAARVRAGDDQDPGDDERRLAELAESLARFAEVVDELRPTGARPVPWGRTP